MPDSPNQIWNNTIIGAGYGVVIYSGSAMNVVNNIFEGCNNSIKDYGGIYTLTGSNNLYFNNLENSHPLTNPVYADPDFVSAAIDDYHLNEESPAINAGTAISLMDDFDDEPRPSGGGYDIGADEIQGGTAVYLPILLK